ncbi:MAG: hypothetical protein KI790_03375 [Cyclobacteriaceae bacterium]|nr:hypothetical protein [Cyclobacteriaceae bacterium HetDA_MAG_MS6]
MNAKWLILFFWLCGQQSWCQGLVSDITFSGNVKTDETYLTQFLKTSLGQSLDSTLLREDMQRLSNLESLASANFLVLERSDGHFDIEILCEEVFTILPIFNFGGVEDNFWFQVGVTENNLAGQGHKAFAYYQLYDRSSAALALTLRRYRGSRWSYLVNFVKWSTLEPLFFSEGVAEYNYDNYTYGLGITYHFDFHSELEGGLSYFTEAYEKQTEGIPTAPDRANTNKLLVKLIHRNQHINYHFFYEQGYSNVLTTEAVYSLNGDPDFYIFFNDFKYIHRLGNRGNIGARLRVGLSTNEESPFAPFVLDSYLNIRGIGNRVDRGTGTVVLNSEYRHAILDRPQVAMQGVLFSDTGTWRNPGGDLSDFSQSENFVLFGGAGLRFIHKKIYNAILRVDYGFDLQDPGKNGFVIGIGQYF